MPLPLAMMIPFMGIQSAVMAKQFGENFQYGKRRISAMDNAEFNKLTPMKLQENANAELKAMIPSMEDSVKEMRNFQTFLIGEFISMINDAIGKGLGVLFGFNPGDIFPSPDGNGTDTTPPGTTPPPGQTTITYTVTQVKGFSNSTINQLKKKIVEGNHVLSSGTVALINQEFEIRFGGTGKNKPVGPFFSLNKFGVPIITDQMPSWHNLVIKSLNSKTTSTAWWNAINALYAQVRDSLFTPGEGISDRNRKTPDEKIRVQKKKEIVAVIAEANKIINT